MTHTKQFIEDAIEGGWNHKLKRNGYYSVFLDPQAWRAVGKTRGCGVLACKTCGKDAEYSKEWIDKADGDEYVFPWAECSNCGSTKRDYRIGIKKQWHQFIDHLDEGKTVEEALAAIAD